MNRSASSVDSRSAGGYTVQGGCLVLPARAKEALLCMNSCGERSPSATVRQALSVGRAAGNCLPTCSKEILNITSRSFTPAVTGHCCLAGPDEAWTTRLPTAHRMFGKRSGCTTRLGCLRRRKAFYCRSVRPNFPTGHHCACQSLKSRPASSKADLCTSATRKVAWAHWRFRTV